MQRMETMQVRVLHFAKKKEMEEKMEITLPVQQRKIENGKIVTTDSEQKFDLDMSLNAQIRFEAKFPDLAQREDLFGYSQRIFGIEEKSSALIVSKFKLIYCWLDTEMSFKDFLKLFDLSDEKYIKKLVETLNSIFKLISSESAEKN